MANKNTKRRQSELAKANKGNWPKPVFKAKVKDFPSKDGMSLIDQRKWCNRGVKIED